ncbi:hypothetical protein LINGRAHAP2_LOCUS24449 [Linum grandiflorum]
MLWCHECSKLNTSQKGISCQLRWDTDRAMYGEALLLPKPCCEKVSDGGLKIVVLLTSGRNLGYGMIKVVI